MSKNDGLRYIAYVRKSSEDKEMQELSHRAQERKIKEQFPDLNIVEWMPDESASAFKTGRPIFNQMLDKIDNGEADGIVAWHPNRLARNEIDAARITYALRGKMLKNLKFGTYTFENNPEGVMMLQVIMSQSQYESAKSGRDVKKGMEQKIIEQRERPGVVPTGYMKVPLKDANGNPLTKKDRIITTTVNDPDCYDMVKKMWKMLLSGLFSAAEIRNTANKEWKYTTRYVSETTGGNPITDSAIYRMFTNPFYAGIIMNNGKSYPGHHEPMITFEEFEYAQKLLGGRGKPRTWINEYAYSTMMKCGECGCAVVGKTNTKYLYGEKRVKTYVHYYCTRKSKKRPCLQNKYTSLESIENEIAEELAKYEILPEFRDLALKVLKRNNKIEVKDRTSIYESQQKKRKDIQAQLDSLLGLRTRNVIDDDEYSTERGRLKMERDGIDLGLRGTEKRADEWLELTERAFNFATYSVEHFKETQDLKVKRDILMTLGQNLILKDQKLTITPHEWLVPIGKDYPEIEKSYLKGRTKQKAMSKELETALEPIFQSWCG